MLFDIYMLVESCEKNDDAHENDGDNATASYEGGEQRSAGRWLKFVLSIVSVGTKV